MANRYWVGGTGTWSDATNHWSDASGGTPNATFLPTSADNVYFDSASAAANYTVTVAATANCFDFTCAAPSSGNLTFTINAGQTLNVYGSLALYSGMTFTGNTTANLVMAGTSVGKTVKTAGVTANVTWTFTGVGSSCTLLNAMNVYSFQHTNGTLDTGNYNITCSSLFTSSSSNTRTLTTGTSTITALGVTFVSTNLTYNFTNTVFNMSGGSGTALNGGGLTFGTFNLSPATYSDISGANTFATLNVTFAATANPYITFSATNTITNFVATGTAQYRGFIQSNALNAARTLNITNATITYTDIQDIAAGSALNLATSTAGDAGGNTNITFPTPLTMYWYQGSGNFYDATKWYLGSGGTGGLAGRSPLLQDTCRFDANSFTSGSKTLQNFNRRVPTLDFTGASNTPTVTGTTIVSFYGSLTLTSPMSFSVTGPEFNGRGANTFKSAGLSIASNIYVRVFGGSLTLSDALTLGSGYVFTLYAGTFNTGGNALTVSTFTSSGSGTRTINFGASLVTLTGSGNLWDTSGTNVTVNAGTSTLKLTDSTATNKTLVFAAGQTFYNVWFTGTGTGTFIFNNGITWNEIRMDTPPHTLKFPSGQTTTCASFVVSGTAGNLMTIGSTSTSASTLTKSGGGIVSCDYLNVSYSTATPGTTWYAGTNSTNGGNNTGWIFTAPPSTGPAASRRIIISS